MTLLKLFGVLFAVNLLTIGGGYVTLPLLHRFFVEDFGWLTSREFVDCVAVGQVTPGPMTLMNAFIGQKVAGVPGALVATIGSYLPSVLVVTLVTRYYLKFRSSRVVASVFRGVKPAVAGMLLAVTVGLARVSLADAVPIVLAVSSFALLSFTRIDPTVLVVAAGLVGAAFL
jgi:chromate transporter